MFTRHIRQTFGVTGPRNTGCCKRLLTVICSPGLHCAFGTARRATLHCPAIRAATARKTRTNRTAWSPERCPVTPCFPACSTPERT